MKNRFVINESQVRSIIRKILSEVQVSHFKSGEYQQRSSDSGDVLGPDSSASIKGKEFTVHGVKFQSVPAEGAGNVAAELYQSAEKAGQKAGGKDWENQILEEAGL